MDSPFENWIPVVFAADLPLCECCDEPWCEKHDCHYGDDECSCPGPHQDDLYDYKEDNGTLFARLKGTL